MHNRFFLSFFAFYLSLGLMAQNLLEAKPAELQLAGETPDGNSVLVQSSHLIILYRPGGIDVSGELMLNSLVTDDPGIIKLLETSAIDRITFETVIPPDRFVFGQATEVAFTSEATLYAGGLTHEFTIDFIISHNRIAETNTFLISGIGSFSLTALGLNDLTGYEDTFRFYFRQNVVSKKVG